MVVPAGTFVIAPILLKSNITLQLDKGSTLLGSTNMDEYPMVTFARHPTKQPLVSAVNARTWRLWVQGTIDGSGKVWWTM